MNTQIEKEQMKSLIKESISEAFEQNREYFGQIIEEIIEDKFFLKALKEGEETELVSREEIFNALKNETWVSQILPKGHSQDQGYQH